MSLDSIKKYCGTRERLPAKSKACGKRDFADWAFKADAKIQKTIAIKRTGQRDFFRMNIFASFLKRCFQFAPTASQTGGLRYEPGR
jgi:hypothetical protein